MAWEIDTDNEVSNLGKRPRCKSISQSELDSLMSRIIADTEKLKTIERMKKMRVLEENDQDSGGNYGNNKENSDNVVLKVSQS